MTGWRRSVIRTAIILVAACGLVYLSLFVIVKSAGFQNWLKSTIAKRTGYELKADDLGIEPPLALVAYNAAISRTAKTILQSQKISVSFTPIGLLSRRIHRLDLVKPTFFIDPHQFVDSSSQTSFDVTLRHLNIRDGNIVLETGDGNSIAFRSIMMDAENVNLGGATGLDLRMELPWLGTRADIAVRGEGSEKIIAITIQQTDKSSAAKSQSAAIRAELKLRKKESRELEILATGQLNELRVANEPWSGQFNIEAAVDAAFKEVGFSGKYLAPGLPQKIGAFPLILNRGPITSTIAGNYLFAKNSLTVKSLQIMSASGMADGSGTLEFTQPFSISGFRLNVRNIPPDALRPLLPENLAAWTYNGTTEADLELEGVWSALTVRGAARSNGTDWKSKQFSLAELSLQAPFRWAQGSLNVSGLRLVGKKLAIDQEKQAKLSAEEILVDGDLEKSSDAPLKARGKVQIRGGRFANLAESKMGENLALTARFDAATIRQSNASLAGVVDIEQGEILWEKFFTDLKSLRPAVSFDGDYAGSDDALRLRRFNLSLANIGRLDLAGTVEQLSQSPLLGVSLQTGDLKPGGVFDFLLRDALKSQYPIIDQLTVGGRIGLSARAEGRFNDLLASGVLQLQGGSVGAKSDKWRIGPIGMTLPFRIHWPSAKADSTAAKIQAGTLVVESARFGTETIPSIKTIISMRNNILRFEQPLRIGMYGGTIEIGKLVWNDIVAQPQVATFSVDVQNLQLQKLTEALDWYRFSGTMSGSIPRVEWAGKLIRTQGQIQTQVFRGRLQTTKLEIENPFSSLFSVKLDTRFQDVDLEQVTKTFEFGSISGILEGSMSDLVITNGQPAQFVADFHTVEKSGVSQWISVEALNKITVLSSGTNASALYGGLTRLFDSFRYSKLGFKATLKNDQLTLRGIESRDGKEYLVVGSLLPPTVNVISHTQEIGFGELLRRLKQIQEKPQIN